MSAFHRPSLLGLASALLAASLLTGLGVTELRAEVGFSVLDQYREEISRLVDAPGGSNSVAAGRINPAAWPIQRYGGLYLELEDRAEIDDLEDFTGVLSLRNLGFGLRRQSLDGRDHYDYTLGLGFGDRGHSFGISYAWASGQENLFGDSERWTVGDIYRARWGSLGVAWIYENENDERLLQADVGVRPLGPRWTLFADALGSTRNFDLGDFHFGYGVQGQLMPGVTVAVRGRDDGEIGMRLGLSFGGLRASVRNRIDNDADRVATTYAVESAHGPNLGQVFVIERKQSEIALKGSMTYRRYRFFDRRPRFAAVLDQIDRYAADPTVGGVVLNLSGMHVSAANLWELRAQLAGLRRAGKTVAIYFDRLPLFGYMMASVADELWMDPQGDLDLRGLNLGRSYYHEALAKLGVGLDELRFFTYKSALETYSRRSFSDADREQFEAVLEDFYAEAVDQILSGRGLSREDWDAIVDEKGLLLPREAQELGLVDGVGSYQDMKEGLADLVARPGSDSEAAPLGVLRGDPIWRDTEWGQPPRIALLYAIGPCEMDSGIQGRKLSKLIRRMRDDRRVKTIVLRADSPGGDPLPSDLVARELRETAEVKPVIISQGQVAGSGGYWISMYGDRIVASPLTITGSIGVIGAHVYDDGFAEKVGMDYDHVQIGRSADLFDGPVLPFVGAEIPHRPMTKDERERAERVIRELYGDFVDAVAEGRHLSSERVDEIGQGRIWSGIDGTENGLVDSIGGLWSALVAAKQAAGLEPEDPVDVVEGPGLGLFDSRRLRPSLTGLSVADWLARKRELAEPAAEPGTVLGAPSTTEKRLLDGAPFDLLSPMERLYLEALIRSGGKPLLLMEPLNLGPLLIGWE